jgi:leader peptidase (prepilin peptidase) / N-methyltransferase
MLTSVVGIAAFAVAGAVLGFAADRLSVRWPHHEEDYQPRGIDWRTAVVTLAGAIVFGGIAMRWGDKNGLVFVLGFGAALIVLLATDLDQRVLPDWITFPLIGYSAILLVAGWSPLLATRELGLVSGIAAGIGAPAFLLVTDRLLGGELGLGDVKLAVSIGLFTGVSLIVTGLLAASIGFSVVLLALMAVRRIGMRSAVPFGPVLIFGAFISVLVG